MKNIIAITAVLGLLAFSCTDHSNAPVASAGGNPPPALSKCAACVHLMVTQYYRSTDSTWCVGMRLFKDDGTVLPLTGNYTWWWDTTPCDTNNTWSHYADSTRCLTVSGLNDHNRSMSRFAFKASYNGTESPRIIIGRDMSDQSVTGCLADPCYAADSLFHLSLITCDSLSAK